MDEKNKAIADQMIRSVMDKARDELAEYIFSLCGETICQTLWQKIEAWAHDLLVASVGKNKSQTQYVTKCEAVCSSLTNPFALVSQGKVQVFLSIYDCWGRLHACRCVFRMAEAV